MSEAKKTHWKQLRNPNYLGGYSFQPGEEMTVTITGVTKEMVKGVDGLEDQCTIVHLKDQKPFILNVINAEIITNVIGVPYVEDWAGKSITIYAKSEKYFGKKMDVLRVKDGKPKEKALPELTPDHKQWQEAVKFLSSDTGTIEQIKKKYFLTEENQELLISEAI